MILWSSLSSTSVTTELATALPPTVTPSVSMIVCRLSARKLVLPPVFITFVFHYTNTRLFFICFSGDSIPFLSLPFRQFCVLCDRRFKIIIYWHLLLQAQHMYYRYQRRMFLFGVVVVVDELILILFSLFSAVQWSL